MKAKVLLPLVFALVFAISRIPGLFPPNFSAAYALMFCGGVFLAGRLGWWLPLGIMLLTDVGVNLYYLAQGYAVFDLPLLKYQVFNYVGYAALILLGRRFSRRASFLSLLGGGLLGAILFYILTNTASWFFNPFGNPEYSKTLLGWLTALTKGTAGWPSTWEFFRNSLLSGGLFTSVFVGAMKLAEAPEEAEEPEEAPEATPEEKPDEVGA